jgi:hypothetical protein
MMYYTKDGEPSYVPQTDEQRFAVWVQKVSDWRLVVVKEVVKNRFGKPCRNRLGQVLYKEVEKVVGTGIAEPTEEELARACAKPCRYRRAARASRA